MRSRRMRRIKGPRNSECDTIWVVRIFHRSFGGREVCIGAKETRKLIAGRQNKVFDILAPGIPASFGPPLDQNVGRRKQLEHDPDFTQRLSPAARSSFSSLPCHAFGDAIERSLKRPPEING